ncbi:MAG: hypothetical protein ACBR15_19535 [Microcoleus sp.]
MSTIKAGQKYSKNNIYQGFNFAQHKHLGLHIKHRRDEALSLSVVSSWCYGKTSKAKIYSSKGCGG